MHVFLDKEDVHEEIRSEDVTTQVRHIAQMPQVREIIVQWQQGFGKGQSLVGEGRDLGTVVFPQADFKFYLDADPEERAKRRTKELEQKGVPVAFRDVQSNMQERDKLDITRKKSPLKKPKDSIVIDSTHLDAHQVVDRIIGIIQNG